MTHRLCPQVELDRGGGWGEHFHKLFFPISVAESKCLLFFKKVVNLSSSVVSVLLATLYILYCRPRNLCGSLNVSKLEITYHLLIFCCMPFLSLYIFIYIYTNIYSVYIYIYICSHIKSLTSLLSLIFHSYLKLCL